MRIFVSHVSAYQRVATAEEDFNNRVNRMNSSVDINQPLFPATSVIAQWAHGQVAMVADVKVMHGLSSMDISAPRPAWLQQLSVQSSSSRDPTLSP